jgi:hypothetical protein
METDERYGEYVIGDDVIDVTRIDDATGEVVFDHQFTALIELPVTREKIEEWLA